MKQDRITHTLIGLTLTLALSVCFLEYKTIAADNQYISSSLVQLEDEVIVEINKPIIPPPPPPPPAIPEVVEVVKDEEILDKPIVLIDPEIDIDIVINIEENEEEPVVEVIFDVVEELPEFLGGVKKLYEYLGNNINYPEQAKDFSIQGKVFVQFVVWKDGTIKDVKVVKGAHKLLNKEALRVINNMPKWKPGKQRGKNVNAKFTLPISFRLQ
jgi:protein TonB